MELWVDLTRHVRQMQYDLASALPAQLQAIGLRLQSTAFGQRLRALGYKDPAVVDGLASGFPFSVISDLGPWGLWADQVEATASAPDTAGL